MGVAEYAYHEVTHEYGEHKDISWLAERDNAKSIKNMFHIFGESKTDWEEYTCSFWCADGYLLARGPIQLIGSHVDCECVYVAIFPLQKPNICDDSNVYYTKYSVVSYVNQKGGCDHFEPCFILLDEPVQSAAQGATRQRRVSREDSL